MSSFLSFAGIDYSGAGDALKPLKGIQVYLSKSDQKIIKVLPKTKPSKHWCRKELANWIVELISKSDGPKLVGIDHALSFPAEYFEKYRLPWDWDHFLTDFESKWPTNVQNNTVQQLLMRNLADPEGRCGNSRWRRLTDKMSKGAKSVFHFGVPGAVASSTHAGLTWINYIRKHPACADKIHFWPFDGWLPPKNKSVIAEVYPALWNKLHDSGLRTQDEHDAWSISRNLKSAFSSPADCEWFDPDRWKNIRLTEEQKMQARIEGWILGLN
jgi:hypothetical protein